MKVNDIYDEILRIQLQRDSLNNEIKDNIYLKTKIENKYPDDKRIFEINETIDNLNKKIIDIQKKLVVLNCLNLLYKTQNYETSMIELHKLYNILNEE